MTQKERQERSREEIYQAALNEFGTHGYDNVNMERICGNHGISKGMMYHYYSGKDDLFLLCVERTFAELKACVEQELPRLENCTTPDAIREFFLIREAYFQSHPLQKTIFESAMLRPPKHLTESIHTLRAPIRQLNQRFIEKLVIRMPLRADLQPERVIRYLESVEPYFQNILFSYQGDCPAQDFHTMLKTAGELLDMALFGILRQDGDPDAFPAKQA